MSSKYTYLIKLSSWLTVIIAIAFYMFAYKSSGAVIDIIKSFSSAISISAIVMPFYNLLLWRYDPLNGMIKLHKKYDVTFESTHGGGTKGSGCMSIEQTFLTQKVVLKTDKSTSCSFAGTIEDAHCDPKLIYSYINEPNYSERKNSEIHYGTTKLDISNVDRLSGGYYTDRGTTGDMICTKFEE